VAALLLSAPYLPSQLEALHEKVAKLQHSLAVLVGASELHVVVSKLPWEEEDDDMFDDQLDVDTARCTVQQQQQQQQRMPAWQQVLLDGLGPAQLLDPGHLAAAEEAEEALLAQQRLFSTAVWNAAAQQLQAKHCLLPWLAVLAVVNGEQLRSLRGLAATQGLHLAVEDLQQQQQQQQEAPPARSSRRRPKPSRKRTTTTADAAAEEEDHPATGASADVAAAAVPVLSSAGPVQEVLLVLSKQPLAAADIAVARQQALASSSSSSSAAEAQPPYQPGMSLRLAGLRRGASSAGSAVSVATDSAEARDVLGARMHVSNRTTQPVLKHSKGQQQSDSMSSTQYMYRPTKGQLQVKYVLQLCPSLVALQAPATAGVFLDCMVSALLYLRALLKCRCCWASP
jgi:hypothetical protein